MFSQGGKSRGAFNIAGQRLDDDPAPILYIGPTRNNVTNVIEPKIDHMLRNCARLWEKTVKGKRYTKTKKLIGGVSFRLAWAGSATELAADSACIVLVDEIDRMEKDIKGEGNVIELADARHNTYPDGKTIGFSTPTEGNVETEVNPDTGLEHWKPAEPEQLPSAIWVLWQEGSRHEWAWPCPECREYFVPRFRLLTFPDRGTPAQAKRSAYLACPHCGVAIASDQKDWMNARGIYVAPGQRPEPHQDGDDQTLVVDNTADAKSVYAVDFGDFVLPEGSAVDDATFWVSGLANFSSKKTFGDLAARWVRAVRSGEPEKIKGVLNTQLGECFRFGGDAPDWELVLQCAAEYSAGTVPADVIFLTCGVDVQKDRLVYVVRGWGLVYTSWLIESGELWGPTDQPDVWAKLDQLLASEWDGASITKAAIDRQYRSDHVDAFCRSHRGIAVPAQGHDKLEKPYKAVAIDVTERGRIIKKGLQLWHFDADITKSWVHSRVEWPRDKPGAWHLPADIDEDYCRQIIAEQRVVKPSGGVKWIQVSKHNHFLDCEGLAYLAARISGRAGRPGMARSVSAKSGGRKRIEVRSNYIHGR